MADRHETLGGDRTGEKPVSDDLVVAFQTDRAGAMGRVVKLGASIDEILGKHAYPEPVAHVLGEALALTAMLGTTLKMGGRLTLQTSSNGPISMLVANFDAPGHMRGYASFDESSELISADQCDQGKLLGKGHLALTVDPGGEMDRYQGIVALEGGSLSKAALEYFQRSEQLPTYLRLAVARQFIANTSDDATGAVSNANTQATPAARGSWHWRAGGLLVQHVARGGGVAASERSERDGESSKNEHDLEDWNRTRILAATVSDVELVDPLVKCERLLYRLFHEEGVRVTDTRPISALCKCSRERVDTFVKNFSAEDLEGLREPDGSVAVTCEFCNTAYRYPPGEL